MASVLLKSSGEKHFLWEKSAEVLTVLKCDFLLMLHGGCVHVHILALKCNFFSTHTEHILPCEKM